MFRSRDGGTAPPGPFSGSDPTACLLAPSRLSIAELLKWALRGSVETELGENLGGVLAGVGCAPRHGQGFTVEAER